MDLFGPNKHSMKSSLFFDSIFGPSSRGLGRDSTDFGNIALLRKPEQGGQFNDAKHDASDYTCRSGGENSGINKKDKSSIFQNEAVDSCYFSSSIFYGGQEIYSPASHNTPSHHLLKKDEEDDDLNGNNLNWALRGNWWQGSLYY